MHELLAVTNALADESRVRALVALTKGELCVCQIAELHQHQVPGSRFKPHSDIQE